MSFAGFSDADFGAYAPQKWKSNVFNRERLEVKQKLLALGRELGTHLVGGDGSPLVLEASVEHPALWNHKQVEAQHIYFSRNEGERKELDGIIDRAKTMASLIDDPTPQRNHLFLVVTLTHERAEVALKLHPDARVDRQNLERKLSDHFECERMLAFLHRLPDGFVVGTTGGATHAANAVAQEPLLATVQALGNTPKFLAPGAQPPLWFVGRSVPRADVIASGGAFADAARRDLEALLPLYQFVAWSRDNDFVSMRAVLDKEKQVRRQRGIAKGDEVRIVKGLFAGKSGTVQEVDPKGNVRVLVGKISVKLDAQDVDKA